MPFVLIRPKFDNELPPYYLKEMPTYRWERVGEPNLAIYTADINEAMLFDLDIAKLMRANFHFIEGNDPRDRIVEYFDYVDRDVEIAYNEELANIIANRTDDPLALHELLLDYVMKLNPEK